MLLTGTKKRDHISPILASLHWLPVKFRIDFKIAVFVYKALAGLAPKYISDLLIPYSPQRALRSSNQLLLTVPLSESLSHFSHRSHQHLRSQDHNHLHSDSTHLLQLIKLHYICTLSTLPPRPVYRSHT